MNMKHKYQKKGTNLTSMAILLGLVGILTVSSITILGSGISKNFSNVSSHLIQSPQPQIDVVEQEDPYINEDKNLLVDNTVYQDCNEAFNEGLRTDGYYKILAKGNPTTVFCHMYVSGLYPYISGGYTLIALQYEDDPAPWGEGKLFAANAAGFPSESFSLSPDQIPEHTLTGFGGTRRKDLAWAFGSPTPFVGIRNVDMAGVVAALRDGNDLYDIQYNWAHTDYQYIINVKHGEVPSNCNAGSTYSLSSNELANANSLTVTRSNTGGRVFWQFNQNMDDPSNNGLCYYDTSINTDDSRLGWGIFVR